MKRHILISILCALVLNCILGAVLAAMMGYDAIGGAVVVNLLAIALGQFMPRQAACAGVLREVWTGELIKALRSGLEGSWLDGIPDNSSLVDNDAIHMVDVGASPTVLINNTTYPIDIEELDDGDKLFKLDKFQTKVTPITDDELYARSYDKMTRVKESHANALNDSKFAKAAHALCATKNTATTPVLKTTGSRDAATGRIKLCMQDLVNMKRALDNLLVPSDNRRLVLCPDHVNDLLETEQSFREQYNVDRNTGKVGNLYGFDIYEYANNPIYSTAGEKQKVGAVPTKGQFQCSFAYYVPRVFKATGSTKMYYSIAANDPQYQRNLISYRHYFIVLPKKEDAGCVMMSDYQAEG